MEVDKNVCLQLFGTPDEDPVGLKRCNARSEFQDLRFTLLTIELAMHKWTRPVRESL